MNSPIRVPSLLAALLDAASLRIAANKPLKAANDEMLVRALNDMSAKFRQLDTGISHGSRDTVEQIVADLIESTASIAMDWWVGSSDTYSQVTSESMFLKRLAADLAPEYLTRLHLSNEGQDT